MLGQAMRPGAVAQQRDVTERWIAVGLLSGGDISHDLNAASFAILGIDPEVTVTPARDTLGGVEADEVAACELVENAPDLCLGIGADIGRRRLAYWITLRLKRSR